VFRSDQRFAQILNILIDDIDNYNKVEAERLEEQLKKIFDFNLFRKVMREHFERQQRRALRIEAEDANDSNSIGPCENVPNGAIFVNDVGLCVSEKVEDLKKTGKAND